MTMLVEAPTTITGEELAAMGLEGLHELVEGKIVEMSPTGNIHGGVELNIGAALLTFVRTHDLGHVRVGEVGIYTQRNPDTIRAADVLFISHARYQQVNKRGFFDIPPELVVEVLSPYDRWSTVTQKLREYFEIGVDLVWVADPEINIIYAYRSLTDVREFTEEDKLPGDDILPGFYVPVASLFDI